MDKCLWVCNDKISGNGIAPLGAEIVGLDANSLVGLSQW